MRGQWFIWALAAAVGIFVLVVFNYQSQQDSVSLTEIFPDQDAQEKFKTDDIEYEFVETEEEEEVEEEVVPPIPAPRPQVAQKPPERQPEVPAQNVKPERAEPTPPKIIPPAPAVARTESPKPVAKPSAPAPRNIPSTPSTSPQVARPAPAPSPTPVEPGDAEVIPAESLNTPYTIQVASFKDLPSAQISLKGVKAAGHPGYIVSKNVTGKGVFYRVYVGKFETKAEADQKLSEMKPKFAGSFIISP